jgi:assimilatory nitrate reductase catalytic subunit
MTLHPERDAGNGSGNGSHPGTGHAGPAVRVEATAGGLCRKGWTAADLLDHPDRLRTPLLRPAKGAAQQPATWDEAMGTTVATLRRLRAAYGRDAVAVFGGGGLTNEKAYALGKFARVALGTRYIDYNGRFCMSSAAAAGNAAFGVDRGLPFPIEDIAAADVVLLAGANSAETMPPFVRHLTAQRAAGGRLIVIDPRATPTAREATLHLQPTPGTDLALANGLLHVLVAEGRTDPAYIAARTTGFDEVRATVAGYWPARVERITGVPAADLMAAARMLAAADRAVVLTGRGAEQHAHGTATVGAFINLALALGLPGSAGSGYGCITGQGNGQGGREHGQKADQLPGYRSITDPAARAHVAAVWGVDPHELPGAGVSAVELIDRLGADRGGPRALLVFGANPVVSAPNADRVAERLRALDLLVVADFVPSETARLADVVLPTAQWAEESGTMTNLEGRILRRRRVRRPPDGVRTDLEINSGLAAGLGRPTGFPADPAEVFTELRAASAGGRADYAGVTWARLDAGQRLHWPVPHETHPGTPRLFTGRFATADGRAVFTAVEQPAPAEAVCATYPYHLTTGRVLSQYQSGAQTRRIAALRSEPYVEVHPDLAERLAITDGAMVRVVSRRGELVAAARLSEAIRPDTLFAPFHWPGAAMANAVTSDALIRSPGCRSSRPAPSIGGLMRVVVIGYGPAGARLAVELLTATAG